MQKIIYLALLICYSIPGISSSVDLVWDKSVSQNVGGYVVYYGNGSKLYTNQIDVGNVVKTRVDNLTENQNLFFSVKAYDTTKTTFSDFSNEVNTTTKPVINKNDVIAEVGHGYFVDVKPSRIANATKWVWISPSSKVPLIEKTTGGKVRLYFDKVGQHQLSIEVSTPTSIYKSNTILNVN